MPRIESQHTEWKESWRDDLLRWVSGFANAEGGRLEIGRNDKGKIVGLADAPKLLEDLPNKIRDSMDKPSAALQRGRTRESAEGGEAGRAGGLRAGLQRGRTRESAEGRFISDLRKNWIFASTGPHS